MSQAHQRPRARSVVERSLTGVVCGAALWAFSAWAGPWVVAPDLLKGVKNPVAPAKRAEAATRGQALYVKECKGCHGETAKGDGEDAMYFTTAPPDLRAEAVTRQSDEVLFVKLSTGRGDMPETTKKLTAVQRWDLICYLRTLTERPTKAP